VSWPMVKLGDLFDIARGGSPRPIQDFITDDTNGINWISISDASNSSKYIEKTKKKIKKEGMKKSRLVHPGDFLLTNSMSFGRPYIMRISGCIHDGWLVLSPKSKNIDTDYFYHLLGSAFVYKHFCRVAAGAVVKNLNIDLVKDLDIPLPPLAEQKRIAAILDKADSLRRKNQQAIQLADQFLRAVFLDLFGDSVTNPKGWGAVKLGHYCEVGSSKRVFVNEFTGSGIPFYRGTEVGRLSENIDIKPHLFISNNHYDNLKKHSGVPEIGDLLLPSICHDGRIWKVDHKDPFYFKDGRVLWIKVNQNSINSDYLRSYLKNLFLANYSSIASGTTFVELKIVNLKEISVLAPPLDLQIKFSEITNKVIKNYRANKVSLGKSDELFHSLSQKAFAGEL